MVINQPKLTFSNAIEITQSIETATSDAQLKYKEPGLVNTLVQGQDLHKENGKCYRCGRTDHKAFDCKSKGATCHNCKKGAYQSCM